MKWIASAGGALFAVAIHHPSTPRAGGTSVLSAGMGHAARARGDDPGTIYFWSGRRGRYRAFSNFAVTPFPIPAWFDPSLIVEFCRTPRNEATDDRVMEPPLRRPDKVRIVPWFVVRAKFAVPSLRALLLSTDDRVLAEDSPYDAV